MVLRYVRDVCLFTSEPKFLFCFSLFHRVEEALEIGLTGLV